MRSLNRNEEIDNWKEENEVAKKLTAYNFYIKKKKSKIMCVMKIRRVEGGGVTVRMWAPVEWLDDTTKQRWSWNKLYHLKPDEICTLCNYLRTWTFSALFYFSFLIIKKESSYTNTILFSHTSSRLVCWFVCALSYYKTLKVYPLPFAFWSWEMNT